MKLYFFLALHLIQNHDRNLNFVESIKSLRHDVTQVEPQVAIGMGLGLFETSIVTHGTRKLTD